MKKENFICPFCNETSKFPKLLDNNSYRCPNCNKRLFFPIPGIEKGMNIGGFSLETKIGSGAMGEIWLAHQESLDRKIALKILSPKLTRDNNFVNRFKKEIKITAKFNHPNIVATHDAGNDKGLIFFAMTYIDGKVLTNSIKKKSFKEEEALNIIKDLAVALKYIWDEFKILHRDIKPANIIIDKHNIVKLLDMGIAKSIEASGDTLTETNISPGTPYYMSPEQITGDELLDCSSDIYSLGITLYQMLTGDVPYSGKTTGAIFQRHLTANFPSRKLKNSKISKQCEALLKKMMEKDKKNRQSTWDDVISDINLVLKKRFPVQNSIAGFTTRKILAIAATFIALIGIGLFYSLDKNIKTKTTQSIEEIEQNSLQIKNPMSTQEITEKVLYNDTANLSVKNVENWDMTHPLTVAILPFNESGKGVKEMGSQISDLLFAELITNNNIWIVERNEMKKLLDEAELNLSGMVNNNQANQIGKILGAKLIITGSIFKIKNKTFVISKIISTETSKVLGSKVEGIQTLDILIEKLSSQISKDINLKGQDLLPNIKTRENVILDLKSQMKNKKRPKLFVDISETHIGQNVSIDPAAQTELQIMAKLLDFDITEDESQADVIIKGEGFSEFAMRKGNIVSVKARLEIKALDKKQNVIAIDKQISVEIDLVEQIAGKKALQKASAKIAERLLPKICKDM